MTTDIYGGSIFGGLVETSATLRRVIIIFFQGKPW